MCLFTCELTLRKFLPLIIEKVKDSLTHSITYSLPHSFIHSFIHSFDSLFIHSFIHSVVRLATGPYPLQERGLHRVQSSFRFRCLSFFSQSSNSYLGILSLFHLLSIFPSVTSFRSQFLCKMWPIHLTFQLCIIFKIHLSVWLCIVLIHFSRDWSRWFFSGVLRYHISKHFKTFKARLLIIRS